jgi:hypothetical protein
VAIAIRPDSRKNDLPLGKDPVVVFAIRLLIHKKIDLYPGHVHGSRKFGLLDKLAGSVSQSKMNDCCPGVIR